MNGYSYTTIHIHANEQPHIGVSIYPDALADVEYYPAKGSDAQAFIRIGYGAAQVSIGTSSNTQITDEHLRFAYQLLTAASGYLADCERLHAEQNTAAA
ncbi:hypothetical protein [Nonomuraea sp. NPDC049141]|uniref:hypothetical protein n=1 Tax=Nonomuraea sp. NPDC049141 TaxID=3155500 RepID=UPI003401BB31